MTDQEMALTAGSVYRDTEGTHEARLVAVMHVLQAHGETGWYFEHVAVLIRRRTLGGSVQLCELRSDELGGDRRARSRVTT